MFLEFGAMEVGMEFPALVFSKRDIFGLFRSRFARFRGFSFLPYLILDCVNRILIFETQPTTLDFFQKGLGV